MQVRKLRCVINAALILLSLAPYQDLHAQAQVAFGPLKDVLRNKYEGDFVLPSDRKFESNCTRKTSDITRCYVAYQGNMLRRGDLVPIAAVREEDRKLGMYLYSIFALNCKSSKVFYRYVDGKKLGAPALRLRRIDFESERTKRFGSTWKLAPSWSPSSKQVESRCAPP